LRHFSAQVEILLIDQANVASGTPFLQSELCLVFATFAASDWQIYLVRAFSSRPRARPLFVSAQLHFHAARHPAALLLLDQLSLSQLALPARASTSLVSRATT